MTTVRSAKAKGSSFEYDCQYSLQQWTNKPVTRTSERGFQLQYDLAIGEDLDNPIFVIECKRLKGMSWNQAVKFFEKLESVAPVTSIPYLLFQSNHQPCLVMFRQYGCNITVQTFDDFFMMKFEKHSSTRVKKEKV